MKSKKMRGSNIKNKAVSLHVLKACGGSVSMAPRFLNLDIRWKWFLNSHPDRSIPEPNRRRAS